MNKSKILINIFSNWTSLAVMIMVAFFVSPILVHKLGDEFYGIWTMIGQIMAYFTVLDLGVNTAIVRFISMYTAQKSPEKANEIFNASMVFFLLVSVVIISITSIVGSFFPAFFHLETVAPSYAYAVFVIVGIDVASNLLFGVFSATLNALQEFLKMNSVAIMLTLLRNLVLVILLFRGYGLMTLAFIQLGSDATRHILLFLILRKKYPFFQLKRAAFHFATLKQIFNYSVYSFIIAIAGRLIFMSYSTIIGRMLSANQVTFYTIPATLIDYLSNIVGALTSALVPVISSHDAVGDQEKNANLYIIVSKYLLGITLPVIFVLFTIGHDFIAIWMGPEYGVRSVWVLRILLVGYTFSFAQWIANGILMGTSRHAFLAYAMIAEAVANLTLSIIGARHYGLEGVAFGVTIPLLLVNVGAIPLYTCKMLGISLSTYYRKSHAMALLLFVLLGVVYSLHPIHASTYLHIVIYSGCVTIVWAIGAFFLLLEADHRGWVMRILSTQRWFRFERH